jgi:hypothetical protein
MIAQRLIEDARAAGLSIEVEGADLIIEADYEMPPDLLASLRQHKAELIAVLVPPSSSAAPTAEWWRDEFEERAAIREYDGHYTRAEAERLAWGELENRWHREHGERLSADICAGCRRPIGNAEALDQIDGNRVHADRDHSCLIAFGKRWRGAARRALLNMGLNPPADMDR